MTAPKLTATERALLFVADNGLAPRGWLEIQRDDCPDDAPEGTPLIESDDRAACIVAHRAGMPGTAAMYAPATGALVLLLDAPEDEPLVDDYVTRLVDAAEADPRMRDALPKWITIVPEIAARLAGCAGHS